MLLVSFGSCLCSIHWSHVLNREWRWSWSSADRRCSNYIWVINKFIAYLGTSYIRCLMVINMYNCNKHTRVLIVTYIYKHTHLAKRSYFHGGLGNVVLIILINHSPTETRILREIKKISYVFIFPKNKFSMTMSTTRSYDKYKASLTAPIPSISPHPATKKSEPTVHSFFLSGRQIGWTCALYSMGVANSKIAMSSFVISQSSQPGWMWIFLTS